MPKIVTTRDLVFKRPYSAFPSPESDVFIPKGTRVVQENKCYWIDTSTFKEDALLSRDAAVYGFRVEDEDTCEVESEVENG